MNAYTTMGQATIQPRDVATILRASTGSYMAGASLAALERTRGWQADAEVEWLLNQNDLTPHASAPLFRTLRQAIGVLLVRVGQRLAGAPQSGALLGMAPVREMIETA